MRDYNGQEVQVGDRVQVIFRRIADQPVGVVYRMDHEFIYMRSTDGKERGMFPKNVTVVDNDLTMDIGL